MHVRFRRFAVASSVLVPLLVLSGPSVGPLHAQATLDVIASGLDNPRGLNFGPEGALYVVEAGVGGDSDLCLPLPTGPGERCYGPTGAITRIWPLAPGSQTRIATGLPSLAAPDGIEATGAHDISFLGRGNAYVTTGLGADPEERSQLGEVGVQFGRLVQVPASGKWKIRTDVAEHEAAENPDGGEVDSNPYGVLNLPGRRVVADAGANALVVFAAGGQSTTLAVFPNRLAPAPPFLGLPPGTMIPMQAVPTTVVVGPDGAHYVGQLTGFPFPVGGANVYRVPQGGGVPEVYADGFTNIIDIAFGADGSLYVLEIAKNGLLAGDGIGALIRVHPDGTRETLTEELTWPGGIALARNGAIYVTTFSIFPGGGQVVRVIP